VAAQHISSSQALLLLLLLQYGFGTSVGVLVEWMQASKVPQAYLPGTDG
jgi:hypothetical protein